MTEATAVSEHDALLSCNSEMPVRAAQEDCVCLQISAAKLYCLLTCHALGATEFRCLDCTSKNRVQHLLLRACARRLQADASFR